MAPFQPTWRALGDHQKNCGHMVAHAWFTVNHTVTLGREIDTNTTFGVFKYNLGGFSEVNNQDSFKKSPTLTHGTKLLVQGHNPYNKGK